MAPVKNVIMQSFTVLLDAVPRRATARRQSALAIMVADAILASMLKDAAVKKIVHALMTASANVARKMSRYNISIKYRKRRKIKHY